VDFKNSFSKIYLESLPLFFGDADGDLVERKFENYQMDKIVYEIGTTWFWIF